MDEEEDLFDKAMNSPLTKVAWNIMLTAFVLLGCWMAIGCVYLITEAVLKIARLFM